MSAGFRHLPVPALINSAEWTLRPVITRRDHELREQAVRAARIRSRGQPRCRAGLWYLVEHKVARTLIGVLQHAPASGRGRAATGRFYPMPDMPYPDPLIRAAALLLKARAGDAHAKAQQAQSRRRIAYWSEQFSIPSDYATRHQLQPIPEPLHLHFAGRDYVGRSIWLEFNTRISWLAMQRAALEQGIQLDVVSAFRSIEYQADIWTRKRARGQHTNEILSVNVPPGYSEHHSGRAIDISTPGVGPAEPGFADTPAFHWLQQYAHHYGFYLSFPEHNPHGVMYEPWHWCFRR